MPEAHPTVLVIDDDLEFRSSVGRLLRSVGWDARLFASVPDFLKSERPIGLTCLVLDVRLPGPSGLDFQRELAESEVQIPIIFITGHGDVPMSVQAMKRGAIEFLTNSNWYQRRKNRRPCAIEFASGVSPSITGSVAKFVLLGTSER
jgi:FixJ family two-component response regulator